MSKSNQLGSAENLEFQLWRVYNLIHRTSIFCETQEECEHMIQHFIEDEKHSFRRHSEANKINFDIEESLTPLGWEVILFAEEVEFASKDNGYNCTIRRHAISHYIYYHDYDEEKRQQKASKASKEVKYLLNSLYGTATKKTRVRIRKYKLNVNGEVEIFTPYVDTDSWRKDK